MRQSLLRFERLRSQLLAVVALVVVGSLIPIGVGAEAAPAGDHLGNGLTNQPGVRLARRRRGPRPQPGQPLGHLRERRQSLLDL